MLHAVGKNCEGGMWMHFRKYYPQRGCFLLMSKMSIPMGKGSSIALAASSWSQASPCHPSFLGVVSLASCTQEPGMLRSGPWTEEREGRTRRKQLLYVNQLQTDREQKKDRCSKMLRGRERDMKQKEMNSEEGKELASVNLGLDHLGSSDLCFLQFILAFTSHTPAPLLNNNYSSASSSLLPRTRIS